jgi:hypothetical protein
VSSGPSKGERAVGPVRLALLVLAAPSLLANLAIIAVFYGAATHQASQTQPAEVMAISAAILVFLLIGSMLLALRQGRLGLSVALAVVQLLPGLLLGANLVFVALR